WTAHPSAFPRHLGSLGKEPVMRPRLWNLAALLGLALIVSTAPAADYGLKQGTADLKSAGPLAFGPDGILFAGDHMGAAVFAIDTNDKTPAGTMPVKMDKADDRIAGLLGTT